MTPHAPSPNAVPPRAPGDHPLWWAAFLALLAAQAWMTLGLFGPAHTTDRLLDDQPILSGRHPLHLYHGLLGARSFLESGSLSCYDPAFQAGYPKTPVFDDGSRPAEMLLALAGGRYLPWVYKLGVAGLCLLAPCVFAGAARGAGMNRFRACLACGLGMLVWWGKPCRELLEAGDVGLLLATLAVLAQTGLLLRYHRAPGPLGAAGVALTSFLGWFAHPLLMMLSAPLFLLYYFTCGPRHRLLWHVTLAVGLAAAVLANLFWLLDWFDSWWIHTPLNLEAPALTAHTLRALWEAPAWGEPADRTLACFVGAAALVGVVLMRRGGGRPAARLFGLGLIGWLLLAAAAVVWGPAARAGGDRLFAPALLFAVAPAAHALTTVLRPARRWGGWGTAALAGGGALALVTLALPSHREPWLRRWRDGEPLPIGLGADRDNVVRLLREKTNSEARILWEDRRGPRDGPGWTALLPVLTGRAFVGGLDPDADIDHTADGLVDQTLKGRPIDDWTDAELSDYCDRYNVGWVICWSERTAKRFERFREWEEGTEPAAALRDGGPGWLVTLRRKPSFALRGAAHWQSADANRVVLTDLRPDEKHWVVLSLHYQTGLRVSPSRIRIDAYSDPREAVPFVRLELDEPAPVATITWDRR